MMLNPKQRLFRPLERFLNIRLFSVARGAVHQSIREELASLVNAIETCEIGSSLRNLFSSNPVNLKLNLSIDCRDDIVDHRLERLELVFDRRKPVEHLQFVVDRIQGCDGVAPPL